MRALWSAVFLALFAVADVHAGFLDDIGQVLVAPVTAPFEATRAIIDGDDPTTVITDPMQASGRIIQGTANAAQAVHDQVLTIPREAIDRNLGSDWARGFDMLTASQRITHEMGMTTGRFLGGCLQSQQCSLDALVAMPLAAAMRDAYKVYSNYAWQPHPLFRQELAVAVPAHVLNSVRFSVGRTPDFTVPGFLNFGNSAFGGQHAVTLANLVVFSHNPNPAQRCDDLFWVLHELRHVEQYMSYGAGHPLEDIDGFAVDYITGYNGLENDADAAADEWLGILENYYNFDC